MHRPPEQLRRDALRIWQAGVDAVRSDRLVREHFRVDGRTLVVGDDRLDLHAIRRIAFVGAGKAGAGMAAAVEDILGPELLEEKQVMGWINVPEDCVPAGKGDWLRVPEVPVPFSGPQRIHLHGARPPGVNEPTAAGVRGCEEILRIVASLGPDDLCLCLLSGGGSALLPAPVEGITLDDKLALTRHLSAAGANIEELNTVRKQLSRIKGGGLARACRAGRLVSLIISDVLGDPLSVIASGPTVPDSSTPEAALEVLDRFGAREVGIPVRVFEFLKRKAESGSAMPTSSWECGGHGHVSVAVAPDRRSMLCVIGNNATAVDAAAREAERLGYAPAAASATRSEGAAEDVGRHLAAMALRMRDGPGPDCLVSGGEPVVKLVEKSRRGLGGRNQQLVLAAVDYLAGDEGGMATSARPCPPHAHEDVGVAPVQRGIALLSGGTDGEDGPTDAAGAFLDADVVAAALARGFDAADFLASNDAYHFFEPLGALLKTGPTQTNVCDVRVIVVDRVSG